MTTKKAVKKNNRKSGLTVKVNGKPVVKDGQKVGKADKKKVSKEPKKQETSLPGIPQEIVDKATAKREKFHNARRNNDILVVRISSDILTYLSEKGWERGGQGGAATIAREVLESWYSKEVERANAKADGKKSATGE